ncbi:hypothetical protein ACR2XN_28280, partial [Klebsiella pneumoniae]
MTKGKTISKKKAEFLNDKFGSVSKNFVNEGTSKTKKVEKGNIGYWSKRQLEEKLGTTKSKDEVKKKGNRNGKIGINKKNNYTPDKYAPRKTCVKCGSVNHLSVNCKVVQNSSVHLPMHAIPMNAMPNLFAPNAHTHAQYANMSFVPNPYFNTFSMPSMSWNMPGFNNMYASPFSSHISDDCAYEQVPNN